MNEEKLRRILEGVYGQGRQQSNRKEALDYAVGKIMELGRIPVLDPKEVAGALEGNRTLAEQQFNSPAGKVREVLDIDLKGGLYTNGDASLLEPPGEKGDDEL